MVNKRLLKVFIGFSVFFLIISFVVEYFPSSALNISFLKGHRGFYQTIVLGLFTGAVVSAISAAIMYRNYQNELKQRFPKYIFNLLYYFKHLYSEKEYNKINNEWVLRDRVDYSLGFYAEIIKECDILRQDLEIQNIFVNNMDLYDEIIKEVFTIRQYAASISRSLRLQNESESIQLLLGGINEKVETFSSNLIKLLVQFAKMQGVKGGQLVEYQDYLKELAP